SVDVPLTSTTYVPDGSDTPRLSRRSQVTELLPVGAARVTRLRTTSPVLLSTRTWMLASCDVTNETTAAVAARVPFARTFNPLIRSAARGLDVLGECGASGLRHDGQAYVAVDGRRLLDVQPVDSVNRAGGHTDEVVPVGRRPGGR